MGACAACAMICVLRSASTTLCDIVISIPAATLMLTLSNRNSGVSLIDVETRMGSRMGSQAAFTGCK